MNKRVVIGLMAIISLGAIWWTYAEAQRCTQYRTVGGTAMCTKWTTGTVQVEVTFKDDCFVAGEGGEFPVCEAQASADTSDSVAFCAAGPGGPITEVRCDQPDSFFGFSSPGDCEGKHDQDSSGEGGKGHRHHGCTVRVPLLPSLTGCQECCTRAGAGTCVDVTPVVMDTEVIGFAGFSETPVVTVQEHCTINPKKIDFHEVRPYQCNVTATCVNGVGEACPSED
jgi:hypothetical protein